MKFLCHLLVIAAAWTASAQGTYEAISGYTPGSLTGSVGGTSGWLFRPTSTITLTALGCWDLVVSEQGTVQVGLWDESGSQLAADTVTSTSPLSNLARYGTTPLAVQLLADQTYYLGAFSASGSLLLNLVGAAPAEGSFTLSEFITPGSAAAANNAQESAIAKPAGLRDGLNNLYFNTMYLGPTFRYTAVPEPTGLALLCLGGLMLLGKGRGRRS